MRRTALRQSMFWRLLLRSALGARSRALTALLGITVASAVATALLNLYVDIDSKLTKEFGKFGANVLMAAKPGQSFSVETLGRIENALRPSDVAVPVAYAVAKAPNGRAVVVAGTDLENMRKLNSWWSVTPADSSNALMGERAASVFSGASTSRTLSFKGRTFTLPTAATLHTGGAEDSRIYVPMPEFMKWTGVSPSTLEVFVSGSDADITAAIDRLRNEFPEVEVHPVRQIVEAETRVLGKTRSVLFASTLMIAVMVTLCVLATLTASVLEQRRDFALMKALGSSQRSIYGIFVGESLVLGVIGSVIGFVLGCGLAAWIGRVNFHAAVVPRLAVFPPVFVGCLLLTLLSAVIPLSRLQKLEPAAMLRGE